VSHSVHKAHGAYAATVASQPHAAPQAVHGYHNSEKYSAAVVAPAAIPAPYTPANVGGHHAVHHGIGHHGVGLRHHGVAHHGVAHHGLGHHGLAHHGVAHHGVAHHGVGYHAAPAYPAPAPYHAPVVHAPAYHAAPVYKPAPAPYHAPVVHAPAYHAAPVVHHAPAYHAEPAYDGPAGPYAFEYAVADDYSKAAFNAAESSTGDGNAVGSYSVALPDGRTQHVAYTANGYDGYVAEVTYEGTAVYPDYVPNYPAAPGYHA